VEICNNQSNLVNVHFQHLKILSFDLGICLEIHFRQIAYELSSDYKSKLKIQMDRLIPMNHLMRNNSLVWLSKYYPSMAVIFTLIKYEILFLNIRETALSILLMHLNIISY